MVKILQEPNPNFSNFFKANLQTTLRSLINVASQTNLALYNLAKNDKRSLMNKGSL